MVYAHILPTKEVYIGMSKNQPSRRWQPSLYKGTILASYIIEYGWENIQHKVLLDALTKEQAEQWEDLIIQALSMNGLCINERRSGGIARDDRKAYHKQWNEDNKEENKAYMKDYNNQRRSTPEVKIYDRVHNYNRNHTPIETPIEAKRKYLEWGYIPAYIKNDDLI